MFNNFFFETFCDKCRRTCFFFLSHPIFWFWNLKKNSCKHGKKVFLGKYVHLYSNHHKPRVNFSYIYLPSIQIENQKKKRRYVEWRRRVVIRGGVHTNIIEFNISSMGGCQLLLPSIHLNNTYRYVCFFFCYIPLCVC